MKNKKSCLILLSILMIFLCLSTISASEVDDSTNLNTDTELNCPQYVVDEEADLSEELSDSESDLLADTNNNENIGNEDPEVITLDAYFNITPHNAVLGENVSYTVKVLNRTTNELVESMSGNMSIELEGITYRSIFTNGIGTLTGPQLPVGQYTSTMYIYSSVMIDGINEPVNSIALVTVHVFKSSSNIRFAVHKDTYNNHIFNMTIADIYGNPINRGTFIVNLTTPNGTKIYRTANVANGFASISILFEEYGFYEGTLNYEDDFYQNASVDFIKDFVKEKQNINPPFINISTLKEGENLNISVSISPLNAGGYVSFTINGTTITKPIVDGFAKFEFPNLINTTYEDVEFTYSGDENFMGFSNYFDLPLKYTTYESEHGYQIINGTEMKNNITIYTDISNNFANKSTLMEIHIRDQFENHLTEGNVTLVIVDSKGNEITTLTYELNPLRDYMGFEIRYNFTNAGNYTMYIFYKNLLNDISIAGRISPLEIFEKDNNLFKAVNVAVGGEGDLHVNTRYDIIVTVSDINDNNDLIDAGKVTLFVSSPDAFNFLTPLSSNLVNGKAHFAFINLKQGHYQFNISYTNDENYTNITHYSDVDIEQKYYNEIEAEVKGAECVGLPVFDENGNLIINKAVTISINGATLKTTTNKDGVVLLTLTPGINIINTTTRDYLVNLIMQDDEFKVKISTISFPGYYNDGKVYTARIQYSGYQYYFAGLDATVNVYKNNALVKTYNTKTDGMGKIYYNTLLAPGKYKVLINTTIDNVAYTHRGSFTVNKMPLKLVLSKTAYKNGKYTVKVLNLKNSKPAAGLNVKLTINKKTLKAKTDSKGIATFVLKLNPKKYDVKLAVKGNANYNKASSSYSVTVNKNPLHIQAATTAVKNKFYQIKVFDKLNTPVNGIKVSFTINKKTYTAKSNSAGIVQFKITLPAKKYKVVVKATGSASIYVDVNKSYYLNVKKS